MHILGKFDDDIGAHVIGVRRTHLAALALGVRASTEPL